MEDLKSLKVGSRVLDTTFGHGTVDMINEEPECAAYPLRVQFDSGVLLRYNWQGSWNVKMRNRSLFVIAKEEECTG